MANADAGPKRACCLISEMLEETGIDREKLRVLRRQVLEGMITLCQWQLGRMGQEAGPPPRNKARRVRVE